MLESGPIRTPTASKHRAPRASEEHLRGRAGKDEHRRQGTTQTLEGFRISENKILTTRSIEIKDLKTMAHTIHNIGIAAQIGAYSDAVETGSNLRWLLTSGTPGLQMNGDLPTDITGQTELAWKHILRMLARAGMTVADVVKVTQYLTRPEDIPAYSKVRTRFLGEARPASMLLVIPQLVRPEFLVEVEIIAAKAEPKGD
jgi:2-iminobutanoate/2-iminopropanoate deaminase